jgi:hypothetical protein
VEPPFAEPLFDLELVAPRRGQSGGQPAGPPSHLLRLGEPLLAEPPPVTGLEGRGQAAQVPEWEGRDPGADGQRAGPVRTGQLEGAQALQRPPEG